MGFANHGLTCCAITIDLPEQSEKGSPCAWLRVLLCDRLRRSDITGLIDPIVGEQCPYGPGILVGQCGGGDIGVAPLEEPGQPARVVGTSLRSKDGRARAVNAYFGSS